MTALEDCLELIDNPQLKPLLRARLIQIAFNSENAVAVKAIEMLQTGSTGSVSRLAGVSTKDLLELQAIAEQRLLATLEAIESGDLSSENGTGAAAAT